MALVLALAACSGGSTTPPTPSPTPTRTWLQERPVLEIVAPTDPRWASMKPECKDVRGCSARAADPSKEIVAEDSRRDRLLLAPAVLTKDDFAGATAELVGSLPTAQWSVAFSLTPRGTTSFADATQRAVTQPPPQNQIAIVVDGRVVSAPVVMAPITSGNGEISGNFTAQEAKDLAQALS